MFYETQIPKIKRIMKRIFYIWREMKDALNIHGK